MLDLHMISSMCFSFLLKRILFHINLLDPFCFDLSKYSMFSCVIGTAKEGNIIYSLLPRMHCMKLVGGNLSGTKSIILLFVIIPSMEAHTSE